MIDISTILLAAQSQFENDPELSAELGPRGALVGVFVNVDPNQVPWVGIYPGPVNYEPRTLGSTDNWEATPSLRIVCQQSNIHDALQCTRDLQGLVKLVMDALVSDETIGGTVDMINSFNVEYGYVEDERPSMHFQSAIITVGLEVGVQ